MKHNYRDRARDSSHNSECQHSKCQLSVRSMVITSLLRFQYVFVCVSCSVSVAVESEYGEYVCVHCAGCANLTAFKTMLPTAQNISEFHLRQKVSCDAAQTMYSLLVLKIFQTCLLVMLISSYLCRDNGAKQYFTKH